jgi:Flp pilus assembly pilin Flp
MASHLLIVDTDRERPMTLQTKKAARALHSRKGQTLVEYALILAFISVVAISVLINLGTTIRGTFSKINSQLQQAQSSH